MRDETNSDLVVYTFTWPRKFGFVYFYASCVFAKPDKCVFTLKSGAQIRIWGWVWCERDDGLYLVVDFNRAIMLILP